MRNLREMEAEEAEEEDDQRVAYAESDFGGGQDSLSNQSQNSDD